MAARGVRYVKVRKTLRDYIHRHMGPAQPYAPAEHVLYHFGDNDHEVPWAPALDSLSACGVSCVDTHRHGAACWTNTCGRRFWTLLRMAA
jgi:hypothetical protein